MEMWSSASPSPPGLESRDGEMWPCLWFNASHALGNCNNMVMAGSSDVSEIADDQVPDSSIQNITEIYQTWTPVLIFFCALTFFVNVFIVIAARWMRRPLTPTMYFSLSLAAADAVASLTVGLGLVFNSLLPKVYNVHIPDWGPCSMLVLEAIRMAAVIVTVLHLLALAVNHYIGIARPLHYAAIMTKRAASVCMAVLWIVPNAALFAYFSSIENQGFQSQRCKTDFIGELRFRGQYASFFFAPLFFMILIYGHIFIIIRRHQANRRALIQHGSMARHMTPVSSTRAHSTVVMETTTSLRYPSHPPSVSPGQRLPPSGKSTSFHRQRNNCSVSANSESIDHSNNAVNRNVKAIITTLLIVGTFILGWMPAVIWFIVYCKDCIVTFESLEPIVTLPIGITVNSLIVLKSFLDPIIYTARMKDFKVAFHRMRYQVLSKWFPRCRWWGGGEGGGPDDDGTMVHFNRSLLLGNNSMAHSTIHNHPSIQTRRSIRFNQPKINRANSNGLVEASHQTAVIVDQRDAERVDG
ncbi:5-hydroxytryptamine receptor 1B-like [Daphnia carinata]|uniref:5-hydroxytryptamine receptor 1B-like n=1 Tax=Daphnia carinata TaxID=120202 RepID=UPI0025807886|nr:5-hydroxytryptamine receptor 1B-like [Daphnia carinata]